jgi:hypothetical protein
VTRLLPRAPLLSRACPSCVRVFEHRPRSSPEAGPSRSLKTGGVFLGYVEAPDEKAAELMAAKAFTLDEWQRKRLLVRERI